MQADSCCRCSNTAAQFQVLVNMHCVFHQLKKKKRTNFSLHSTLSLTCTWNRAHSPFCHFDVCVLATGTYRPGSGCCTSCTRSRRPLCVQTPLRPRPPSRDEPASRPRTRRTAPAAKTDHRQTHRQAHTQDESRQRRSAESITKTKGRGGGGS